MKICDPSRCCGCMTCEAVCPNSAISAERDEYGFMRPVINADMCVECGLCREKCPVNKKNENAPLEAYAAYNKDTEERMKSSSGGIFALLAKETLECGGAVVGAGYDENFSVRHKIITDKKDLSDLMGSKYLQSDTSGLWKSIKDHLQKGCSVLFSGTPCQCAALRSFLGRDYDNLTVVDIICHGVPTPKLWQNYLAERFPNTKEVNFRSKKKGWHLFSINIKSDMGDYSDTTNYDPYYRLFFGNNVLRECCYDCNFKGNGYVSDITLGDFWGINHTFPEMNDDKGISAVVIRTERGKKAFESISDKLTMKKCTVGNILTGNPTLNKSSNRHPEREDVMKMIAEEKPFVQIAEKYAKPTPAFQAIKSEIKFRIMTAVGKILSLVRK